MDDGSSGRAVAGFKGHQIRRRDDDSAVQPLSQDDECSIRDRVCPMKKTECARQCKGVVEMFSEGRAAGGGRVLVKTLAVGIKPAAHESADELPFQILRAAQPSAAREARNLQPNEPGTFLCRTQVSPRHEFLVFCLDRGRDPERM